MASETHDDYTTRTNFNDGNCKGFIQLQSEDHSKPKIYLNHAPSV
jgi:hypothetical protein